MTAKYIFIFGTVPFMILGAIHILYTLMDMRAPRKLTPHDDSVRLAMLKSTLALTTQTTMWRAWVGFNISHGMGVLFFGLIYLVLAITDFNLLVRSRMLPIMALVIGAIYFVLSIKYWFRVPAIGTGIGTTCYLLSLILM